MKRDELISQSFFYKKEMVFRTFTYGILPVNDTQLLNTNIFSRKKLLFVRMFLHKTYYTITLILNGKMIINMLLQLNDAITILIKFRISTKIVHICNVKWLIGNA